MKPIVDSPVLPGRMPSAEAKARSADQKQAPPSEAQRLETACRTFESLFINMLLKQMRSTVDKSGLIDGGQAEEITTSMLDTGMAEELAQRGGIGLADILLRQLETRLSPAAGRSGSHCGPAGIQAGGRVKPGSE